MSDNTEYYAIYVVRNQEQEIVKKLKLNIRHNVIPNKEKLLVDGIIDNNFKITTYIHDVAFPHSWDISKNRFTSNLSSYIFIQVEKTDINFFNNLIVPFLKMHSGIIAVCGIQVPTKHKRIDRVTGKKITINITRPVAVQDYELERIHLSHGSFFDTSDEYRPDQKLFYWRLNRKGDPVIYPVSFLRYKDDMTIEIKTLDKNEQKLVLPISQVATNKKIIWRQLQK